jgi:hypothetical protein
MILISQWYEPSDEKRSRELRFARIVNEASGIFESTAYIDGRKRRWTYGDMFGIAARDYPGKVCVVANTDIVFDHTASLIPVVCKENRIVALTRWENANSPNMLGHLLDHANARQWLFSGTQDAWAFVAGTLPSLKEDVPMGVPGCDQSLLARLARAGCEVFSPSIDIRVRHIHSSPEDYEGVPVACGEYAYPKMTSASDPDCYVLIHDCPCVRCNPEMREVKHEVVNTCRK